MFVSSIILWAPRGSLQDLKGFGRRNNVRTRSERRSYSNSRLLIGFREICCQNGVSSREAARDGRVILLSSAGAYEHGTDFPSAFAPDVSAGATLANCRCWHYKRACRRPLDCDACSHLRSEKLYVRVCLSGDTYSRFIVDHAADHGGVRRDADHFPGEHASGVSVDGELGGITVVHAANVRFIDQCDTLEAREVDQRHE